MTRTTSIAWTEKTWNPAVGCSLISPGCSHNCYAMVRAIARHGRAEDEAVSLRPVSCSGRRMRAARHMEAAPDRARETPKTDGF